MIFFFIVLPVAIVLLIYFYKKNNDRVEHLTDYELSKSEKIGKQGEDLIIQECINAIPDQRILRNLYVPTENGNLTELDVVLINRYGIFVIESKNYHSWIFGKANQRLWTLKYPGGKTERLFNPIWQNRMHIKCLQKQINFPDTYFRSLIVFGNDAEIKTNVGDLKEREIILKPGEIKEYINNISEGLIVFNVEFINNLADRLESKFGHPSIEQLEKHRKFVESKKEPFYKCVICGENTKNEDSLCPKCRQKLQENDLKVEVEKKCILCGEFCGSEKLCEKCKKALEDNHFTIEEIEEQKEESNIKQNPQQATEEKAEKDGCSVCFWMTFVSILILVIFICLYLSGSCS